METHPASRGNLSAWLRFTLAPGVLEAGQRALLHAYGTPEEALGASVQSATAFVPEHVAEGLARGPSAKTVDDALRWLDVPGHHLVTIADAEYPQSLRHITDPPVVLYVAGRLELLNAQCFAIVGSRNATVQGMEDARAFGEALSEAGLTIVSGLALGIDAAAHRGGLAGGASSIAVLGTGADIVYPRRNAAIAAQLAAEGAIVTEFVLGTPPLAENFPRRNRLISGMSRGVLVVEAALASGSLITAYEALHQNREVFAMPGPVHSPIARGCHKLIKDGAKLVETAADILEELRIEAPAPNRTGANIPSCSEDEQSFLDTLGHAPVTIDAICAASGRSVAWVCARLSQLELAGHVAGLPGGLFQRLEKHVIE